MKSGLETLHSTLDEGKIQHVFYESPGTDHEWQTWRRDLKDFAPRLFHPTGHGAGGISAIHASSGALLQLAPGVSHLKGAIFFDCPIFLHGPYAPADGPSFFTIFCGRQSSRSRFAFTDPVHLAVNTAFADNRTTITVFDVKLPSWRLYSNMPADR